MQATYRIATVLLIAALALLPAAEWRAIVLPVSGKSLGFDPSGLGSASPFDLVFLAFCIAMLPTVIDFVRRRRFLTPYLAHWAAALGLLALLLATNEYTLPFLTPVLRKVVDARSLLTHMVVMIAVAVYVAELRLETLGRALFTFCAACAVGFAFVSAAALLEAPWFRTHYPFTNPTHLVFPFPTYNVAAIFITLACLGMMATAVYLQRALVLVFAVPVLFLAASLTGSRSNLLVLTLIGGLFAAFLVARRAGGSVRARPAVAWGAAATLAVVLVAGASGWQPIRRAFSIFEDVASDPATLWRGHKGSPRQTMWDLARAKANLSGSGPARDYEVLLTSVRDGCVENSEPVSGLQTGRDYWVRLRQGRGRAPRATLEVFADAGLTQRVGETALERTPREVSRFSMYLADSGSRYVIQAGTLRDFLLTAGGAPVVYSRDGVLSQFDPLNGAPGSPVDAREDAIAISATFRKIRGFVNLTRPLPEAAKDLELRYRVHLDQVAFTLPLDAPAMFYIGLHDTNVFADKEDWNRLRNALLIQHRRVSSTLEMSGYANLDMEEVWLKLPKASPRERELEFERLQRERRCEPSGSYQVAQLWRATHQHLPAKRNFENVYGARVNAPEAISVSGDKSWSSEEHLRLGGSTHNVYLDWYYYEGDTALALFIAFALLISGASGVAAYRGRRGQCSQLLVGVHLQVLVILIMMYAHPYIWIKYYWVVFGLASGLLVNRDVLARRIV